MEDEMREESNVVATAETTDTLDAGIIISTGEPPNAVEHFSSFLWEEAEEMDVFSGDDEHEFLIRMLMVADDESIMPTI